MVSVFKKIVGSQGLRQSLFFSVGNFAAYGISAVALLLISRAVGPVEFGEFWLSVGFLAILAKLQTFGLPIALQKLIGREHQKKSRVKHIFHQSLLLLSVTTLVGAVVGVIAATVLNAVLHLPHLELFYFAILCASITAVFEQVITYLQSLHLFDKAIGMMVLQALAKLVIAGIFISLPGIPLSTLFVCFYAIPIVGVVFGLSSAPLPKNFLHLNIDYKLWSQFWQIMPHTAVMAVGLGLMEYVDVFLLRRYSTPVETGLYSGVSQFALAITLIGQSVAGVLSARVSRYHSWPDLSAYLKKAPLLLVALMFGFLVFLPIAQPLVLLTLGESYLPAVPVLVGLVLAASFAFATVPLSSVMYTNDSSKYFSTSTILLLVIQIGGGFLLIPGGGVSAAVTVRVISRLVVFLYTLFAVLSFLRRKYSIVLSKPS